MSQDKKRVAWITVPAFISTDRFIIPEMAKHYQIDWYLIAKSTETIDFIDTIIDLSKEHDFTLTRINLDHRNISLSTASDYKKFLIGIKNKDYDLVYNVMIGVPYYMPLLRKIIGNKKVLVAIHNVHVPKGGSMYLPSLAYTYYTICKFNYFQTFSVSQKNALLQKHSTKYCDNVNFVLMDYGKSSLIRNDRIITFLSFGIIREYKRIDVLIQAAEEAYNETGIQFRVLIAGGCDDWEKYQKMIKHPQLFDLRIRRIEDREIPDLFTEAHYFVAPYQDIAQSGSAIIAINYNMPVVASKLEAFESYITDKETGFLIKPADQSELKNVICYILQNHNDYYDQMCKRISNIKEEKFSANAVEKLYAKNFETVLDQKL